MPQSADYLLIGTIGAPYGVAGYNHIQSYSKPIEAILNYKHWFLHTKKGWHSIECEHARIHANKVVVKLKGIDDRDAAALITGLEIGIERSALPALEDGEYYWHELEGLEVQNLEGLILGQVDYLYDMGVYANMVVKYESATEHKENQRHIPFVEPDFIKKVDFDNKKIIVDWDSSI